jgi:hypothetical protein
MYKRVRVIGTMDTTWRYMKPLQRQQFKTELEQVLENKRLHAEKNQCEWRQRFEAEVRARQQMQTELETVLRKRRWQMEERERAVCGGVVADVDSFWWLTTDNMFTMLIKCMFSAFMLWVISVQKPDSSR